MKPENFTSEMNQVLSTWGKPAPKLSAADRLIARLEQEAKTFAGEQNGVSHYPYFCGLLQGQLRELLYKLAEFEAPKTGKSERECTYEDFVVHYDLEEADDEVGYAGSVTVNAVYANGLDVRDSLDRDVISEIETHCDETAEAEYRDQKADAAIERYESRRDDELSGAL